MGVDVDLLGLSQERYQAGLTNGAGKETQVMFGAS